MITKSVPEMPPGVSLVRILANPQSFHGQTVAVVGYVRLEFEGDSLYLHRDDARFGIYENGLWLEVPERARRAAVRYHGRYCLVEGTLLTRGPGSHGHMGLWPGALRQVTRVAVWDEDEEAQLRARRRQRRQCRRLVRLGRLCCPHCGNPDLASIRLIESHVRGCYFVCGRCGRSTQDPQEAEQAYLWLRSDQAHLWWESRDLPAPPGSAPEERE